MILAGKITDTCQMYYIVVLIFKTSDLVPGIDLASLETRLSQSIVKKVIENRVII